ncbi:MAG: YiiX/YebB-like N1pC/P60 family cysteine hydrolase [Candidatus Sericytochromatia bacterium]|nr:YiiX/YebB-like N1pC/P60 family cysteine hydrolase [Candidatus Sericytochromatia bacterium]
MRSDLTAEEARLVGEGFLPANFARLREAQRKGGLAAAKALYRAGKKGPFATSYGDPEAMLAGARRMAENPEVARMVRAVRKGDILAITYNAPNDLISKATRGPFTHTVLCVSDKAPPEFIEALGLSGNVSDPNGNKVLRSMMADHTGSTWSVRLLRPTQGLSPLEAEKAVRRAVAYAETQLGKPYDFAFTETNGRGRNDAFYCSELTYKAYTHPRGADLPIRLRKAAARDEAIASLSRVLEGLKPDDQGALAHDFAMLAARMPLDEAHIVSFLADRVAPATALTRAVADTPARRTALRVALGKLVDGTGFARISGALRRSTEAEQAGDFNGVFGLGRRLAALGGIVVAGVRDAHGLTKDLGFLRSLSLTWRLAHTFVPEAEILARFLLGPDDARTRQIHEGLDGLDALARDAGRVPGLAAVWPLPRRARREVHPDFVSPSDLAWAGLPHQDFNARPENPLDEARWRATRGAQPGR